MAGRLGGDNHGFDSRVADQGVDIGGRPDARAAPPGLPEPRLTHVAGRNDLTTFKIGEGAKVIETPLAAPDQSDSYPQRLQ
jgi:hypothetical protein